MLILSNGDFLHSLRQAVIDRLDHIRSSLTLLTSNVLINDDESYERVKLLLAQLVSKGQDYLSFTDSNTNSIFTLNVVENDDILYFYDCEAKPDAEEYTPQRREFAFLEIHKPYGDEPFVDVRREIRSANGLYQTTLDNIAIVASQQEAIYTIISTALNSLISTGKIESQHIINSVKSTLAGVTGVAKTFWENFVDVIQLQNPLAMIALIKQYLAAPSGNLDVSGNWTFMQTNVVNDWFSGTILSGLSNVVSTLGSIFGTLFTAISLPLKGLGFLISGLTNVISTAITTDVNASLEESDGSEEGLPVIRVTLHYGDALWNYVGEWINGLGPSKIEFAGLSGYIYSVDPEHAEPLVTHDDINVELYPSCKGYVELTDLRAFVSQHFTVDIQDVYNPQTPNEWLYSDCTAQVSVPYTVKDLLNWYVDHFVSLDLESLNQNRLTAAAVDCANTAMYMAILLMNAGKDADTAVDSMRITTAAPSLLHESGIHFFHRLVFFGWSMPAASTGIPHEGSWITITNGFLSASEDISASDISDFIRSFLRLWSEYRSNSAEMPNFFISPALTAILVRYPFRLLPPKYDRSNLIAGMCLTTVLILTAVAATTAVVYKIHSWRVKQRAKISRASEDAWNNYVENPSDSNFQRYKKAALKQNTLGKVFGCTSINNSNFWAETGSSASPKANSNDVDSIISLIRG